MNLDMIDYSIENLEKTLKAMEPSVVGRNKALMTLNSLKEYTGYNYRWEIKQLSKILYKKLNEQQEAFESIDDIDGESDGCKSKIKLEIGNKEMQDICKTLCLLAIEGFEE